MKRIHAWFRRNRSLVVQCIVFFALAVAATTFIARWKSNRFRLHGEYTFKYSETDSGFGPRIGERIEAGLFKSLVGKTLVDEIKLHRLTMVVVVDPNCGACGASRDQLLAVRDAINGSGIYYCVLMLPNSDVPSQQYVEWANGMDLKDHAFFSSAKEKPNSALATMVIPSHLLIDASGKIVQKWPGTNRNRDTRERMANQIVSDALKQLSGL